MLFITPIRQFYPLFLPFLLGFVPICAQNAPNLITIEAYLYEKNSGQSLSGANLYHSALTQPAKADEKGIIRLQLPDADSFVIKTEQKGFKTAQNIVYKSQMQAVGDKFFVKIPMQRASGYLLDVSLIDFVSEEGQPAYGIEQARVEIYNNTLQKEELSVEKLTSPSFTFLLEQGNEYIFMIRKKGYYTKRLRANVNINGCILCMEGFGTVTPNTVQNMTSNNSAGALITSVSLKKLVLNETVKVENIYYDKGKAELRPESIKQLQQLGELLRDNPQISIELNAHTDSRGSSRDNLELSQRRADAVVSFLQKSANISPQRLTAKGYGESKLVNSCADGVECSEDMHQPNRRTEFTVVDILVNNDELNQSLASIMQKENLDKILAANEEKYVEVEPETAPIVVKNQPNEKRPPAALPFQYTGYKILLLKSAENPNMDNPIFADFEQIVLDMDDDGKFLYLTAEFKSEKEAQSFLKTCKGRYPSAKVVKYEAGILQN